MTYIDGLFVDDPKADAPQIGLRGGFLLKRLLTNDAADTSIVTVVAGTINGSTIVGLDTPQHNSEAVLQSMIANESLHDSFIKFWDGLIDPKSMLDWTVTVLTFIAAVAVIPAMAFAVYRVYRLVTWKPPTRKAPSRQTLQDNLAEPVEAVKKQGIKWQGHDEADIAAYYNIGVDVMTEIAAKGAIAQALCGAFSMQRIYMVEILHYSELLGNDGIRDLNALLDNITASELAASKIVDETVYRQPDSLPGRIEELKVEMGNLVDYTRRFESLYKKVQNQISTDARETIEETAVNISTLVTDLQRELNKDTEEESDVDPRVEEEIRPEEVI